MIHVTVNEPDFEYDIHSLVKAFFPREDVVVLPEEDNAPAAAAEEAEAAGAAVKKPHIYGKSVKEYAARKQAGTDPITLHLQVRYEGEYISAYLKACKTDDADAYERKKSVPVCYTDREDMAMRVDTKNRLKRLLYDQLSEYTGKALPWGTLTGIRPTKIPMKGLETGKSDEEILRGMKETYLISDEKAALSLEIAKKEREILKDLDYENGYSLYIGIPFCPTRCLYCSFTSYPIEKWKHRTGEYLDALEAEMTGVTPLFSGKKLQSIYIGGGTPTSLGPADLERFLSMIEAHFSLTDVIEYTVEGGRPDSFTPEKLHVLRQHPVTRISVNPQTMNQKTLDLIGRCHTTEQTIEAFYMARDAGFDNINMDLILGLPGEDAGMVMHTLEEIQKLKPDSLTVHSLALKRAARLREEFSDYVKYGMHNSDELMNLVRRTAAEIGLFPYYLYRQKNMAGNLENVGYAATKKEGIYNILIMEEKQTILSLGAAGMTKFVMNGRPVRTENVKDVDQYIGRVDEMIERKKTKYYGIGM